MKKKDPTNKPKAGTTTTQYLAATLGVVTVCVGVTVAIIKDPNHPISNIFKTAYDNASKTTEQKPHQSPRPAPSQSNEGVAEPMMSDTDYNLVAS